MEPGDCVFAIEEAGRIKGSKTIETTVTALLSELGRILDWLTPEQTGQIQRLIAWLRDTLSGKIPRWGIPHGDLIASAPTTENIDALIETLESHPPDLSELVEEADGVHLSRRDKAKFGGLAKYVNAVFRSTAADNNRESFRQLPPNGLIHILKAIRGDSGVALRAGEKTLRITLDDRPYGKIFNRARTTFFLDATADPSRLESLFDCGEPILVVEEYHDNPYANLTVEAVKVRGIKSADWTGIALDRVKKLQEARAIAAGEDIPWIVPKSKAEELGASGWWYNHSRGTNEYADLSRIGFVGLPRPNVGAIEDEYLARHGNLNGFPDHYTALSREEILQGIGGRQRCHRYPDKTFTVTAIIADSDDLTWLESHGARVRETDAFEFDPECGNPYQYALSQIIEAAIATGATTQSAIAAAIGHSQQAVSKILKKAGVTIARLLEELQRLTTTPTSTLNRAGCIYRDEFFRALMELPPIELIEEFQGLLDSEPDLDFLPPTLQIRLVATLLGLVRRESDLQEINKLCPT
jgi:hypothetical protein